MTVSRLLGVRNFRLVRCLAGTARNWGEKSKIVTKTVKWSKVNPYMNLGGTYYELFDVDLGLGQVFGRFVVKNQSTTKDRLRGYLELKYWYDN